MSAVRGASIRSLGFVGLGRMGEPMARRLADSSFDVLAFDRDHGIARRLATTSRARCADSLREIARRSELVVTMLPTSAEVRSVALGREGDPGSDRLVSEDGESPTLILDMGSSDPRATRQLAVELAARGTALLDAPVSGGVNGAQAGDLTIMVGGDAESLEICRPVLARMGRRIFPTGPVGSAHAMKALNNLLSAIGLIGALEVLVAGQAFGLEPRVMLAVLNESSGRNYATEAKIGPFVLDRGFSSGFTLDLLLKDVQTALRISDSTAENPSLGRVACELCNDALRHLGPGQDHTAIARWLEVRTGVRLG